MGLSLASLVNRQIIESSAVDHILNCCFHCSTETPELHRTRARFLTVQHAVTPTKLLPAPIKIKRFIFKKLKKMVSHSISKVQFIISDLPQGKTMTPDLARPFPNIFRKLFSW